MSASVICLLVGQRALVAAATDPPHPMFPLYLGATWTYALRSTSDGGKISNATWKVIKARPGVKLYEVQQTLFVGTELPDSTVILYEIRGDSVLERGRSLGRRAAERGIDPGFSLLSPAPIIVRSNLKPADQWTAGPTSMHVRHCEVVSVGRHTVAAGEFDNVARIICQITFTDIGALEPETIGLRIEYWAQGIGLIRLELAHNMHSINEGFYTAMELTSYSLNASEVDGAAAK